MKKIICLAALLIASMSHAQKNQPVRNWFNLDATKDSLNGVSTERAYEELLKGKKSTTVIVGVLDSGVDYLHEDLKDVMWENPGEIATNGIDDDKNGYIDDIHGWNFLGNKDGKNVSDDNLEVTRVYKKLSDKFKGKNEKDFTSKEDKKEFKNYLIVKEDFEKQVADNEAQINQYKFIKEGIQSIIDKIKKQKGNDYMINEEDLKNFEASDDKEKRVKMIVLYQAKAGKSPEKLIEELNDALKNFETSNFDLENNSRQIVGDNYEDVNEKYYGNPDCKGPGASHGTHVAGIIAAARKNNIGMDGIADNVKIMAVRCVPNGDERDKDIANAIRYAVDNGAQILNMSFGKKYSPYKKAVDEAVKYAESKGVFIIHAAGNSSEDIDQIVHYPCKKLLNGKNAPNFIDVGALSWKKNDEIVAPFSNYGEKNVDLFAPGVDIYSTIPENQYASYSGTSMAAPVVAGVAAVLKSYFPQLTPKQLKKILIKSSVKTYKYYKVIKPGTKDEVIEFKSLTKNGGIVNLYDAIKMASE
jgi:cell wall-associated protease